MATLVGGPYDGRVVQLPENAPQAILMPQAFPYTQYIYIKKEDDLYEFEGEYTNE